METQTVNGMSYGTTASISPSGSPFTWVNNESVPVAVYIAVGTVTDISIAPDLSAPSTFISCGLLGGQFCLNPGQSIKVTYLLAPTMKYHPI